MKWTDADECKVGGKRQRKNSKNIENITCSNRRKDKNSEEERIKREKRNKALEKLLKKNVKTDSEPIKEDDPFTLFMNSIKDEGNILIKDGNTITLEEIEKSSENDVIEQDNYHSEFMKQMNNLFSKEDKGVNNENKLIIYEEDHNELIPNAQNFLEDNEKSSLLKDLKSKSLQSKILPQIDHTKISYIPFIKNTYIESPDNKKLSEMEVQNFRKKNEILIKGKNIPKPIKSFSECGLNAKILDLLTAKNITEPYPIQMQVLPVLMSGRDCQGISTTGTGKTLAYILPMFRHILENNNVNTHNSFIALILVPIRELATQIYSDIIAYTKYLNINCVCIYGGTSLQKHINFFKKGNVHICIATPSRLIDLLYNKVCSLYRCSYVVIDEADRMFDLGFEKQVKQILNNINPSRQLSLFSATFPNKLYNFSKKYMKNHIEILISHKNKINENIEQHIEIIDKERSFVRLLELLEEYANKSIIIFVNTQLDSIELWKQLFKLNYKCALIYGMMDQQDRHDELQNFKTNNKNILITTTFLSRGINLVNCNMVINFNCPNYLEDYIHKIGRCARTNNKGVAYTFIDPVNEMQYAENIMFAMEINSIDVPPELVELVKKYKIKLLKGDVAHSKFNGYLGNSYSMNSYENLKHKIENKLVGSYDEGNFEKKYKMVLDHDNSECQSLMQKNYEKIIGNRSSIKKHNKFISNVKQNKIKNDAIEVGIKAAKASIIAGKDEDEVINIVKQAISKTINTNNNNNIGK